MPNQPIFNQIFARSPISPIQSHMKVANSSALMLSPFFDAVLERDWTQARTIGDKIIQLEKEADVIKREIRSSLSLSIFMPVSRSDLLDLLKSQDRIPNRIKDIIGLILGRKMGFPLELGAATCKFVQTSVGTVSIAMETLEELDKLFESGFSGTEVQLISDIISRLNTVEHEADVEQAEVQQLLQKIENELNPIDVMFLYRIIDWIGDIADNAQAVGNRMLYLIAK